jgi:hypothetical protein
MRKGNRMGAEDLIRRKNWGFKKKGLKWDREGRGEILNIPKI